MNERYSLPQLIEKHNTIAIVFLDIEGKEKAMGVVALAKYIESLSKKFTLLSSKKLKKNIQQIFEGYGMKIEKEVSPAEYIVSIDYGSQPLQKIIYDTYKEEKKLVFKIVPGDGGFDFKNVEFKQEGVRFDATILVDVANPKDLEEIYDKNEYIFKEIPRVEITTNGKDLCSLLLSLLPTNMPSEVNKILSDTLLESIPILEGNMGTQEWEAIANLSKSGTSISGLIRNRYFSKSLAHLDGYKEMFKNIRVDIDNGIIWTKIKAEDINLSGRLPFNIFEGIDLAIALIEISDSSYDLLVESNNPERYSASTICGVYAGNGNEYRASATITNVKDIDKEFWGVLKDLYSITSGDKNATNSYSIVDNSPIVLTKARKNSKNRRLKDNS